MSLQYLSEKRSHPARDAAIASITAIQSKDREGWLALWHQDGLLQDPVGVSPLDPEGHGHVPLRPEGL